MSRRYTVLLETLSVQDGGGIVATVPELPGCMSDGATDHEAVENVKDAIACWIEEAEALGRPIPEPREHSEYA